MARPARVELGERLGAPDDLPGQARLSTRDPAGQVDGGAVLVRGVGLDMLVEERRRRVEPEPPQATRVSSTERSASSDGSHSQRSSTPSKPR